MPRARFEEIADHYRLAILEGRLKEGDRLPPERVIAEAFGAGRSSVREALFSLSRQGLLSISAGARPRVTRPDPGLVFRELGGFAAVLMRAPAGVRELQAMRRMIEGSLAREAAACATPDAVETIARALSRHEAALGDVQACAKADVAFHQAIAESVGNTMMTALLSGLSDWLTEQRLATIQKGADQRAALDHHARILDAIRARDPARALAAMEAHLDEVSAAYWL